MRLAVVLALASLSSYSMLADAQQSQFSFKKVVPTLVVAGGPVTPTDPANPNGTKLLSPSSSALNFTGTQVGDSSSQSIVLSNTGTGTVTLTSVELADIKHFGLSKTCGATLAPAANCLLTVQFNAHLPGSVSNQLTVTSDAGAPIDVPISAMGLQGEASLDKTALTFSSQGLNTTTAPQSVVISNIGNGPLQITGISLDEGMSNFNQENNCNVPLGIGASCTVNVAMTPTVIGPLSGRVLIGNDGSSGAGTIDLTGSGELLPAVLGALNLPSGLIDSSADTLIPEPTSTNPDKGFIYTSSNPAVATIVNGNMLHMVAAGTTTISVTQAATSSYAAPAAPVTALLTVGATPRSYAQWAPAANASISGLTVAASSGTTQVSTNMGVTTGKWYWEYTVTGDTTGSYWQAGIVDDSGNIARVGPGWDTYSYIPDTQYNYNTRDFTPAAGSTFMFALDKTNGALYYGINGVWVAGAVPTSGAARTGALASGTGLQSSSTRVRPFVRINGSRPGSTTANFGAIGFKYTVPAGYNTGYYQ